MRLFEARTILEDLAVIARLKQLGVRGDTVFHRDDADSSNKQIEDVTSGGAIRLCALDSLGTPSVKGPQRRVVRDHFRDLEQGRTNLDLLLRGWDDMSLTERGALLGRMAKLLPAIADGLESVKSFPVLNAITAEDINEIVMKHRGLIGDYGSVADAIKKEADRLGARHRVLPLLINTLDAIDRLLEQHVLFCPKPLHGEKAYDEWMENVRVASSKVDDTKARLDQLSTTHVWALG